MALQVACSRIVYDNTHTPATKASKMRWIMMAVAELVMLKDENEGGKDKDETAAIMVQPL